MDLILGHSRRRRRLPEPIGVAVAGIAGSLAGAAVALTFRKRRPSASVAADKKKKKAKKSATRAR